MVWKKRNTSQFHCSPYKHRSQLARDHSLRRKSKGRYAQNEKMKHWLLGNRTSASVYQSRRCSSRWRLIHIISVWELFRRWAGVSLLDQWQGRRSGSTRKPRKPKIKRQKVGLPKNGPGARPGAYASGADTFTQHACIAHLCIVCRPPSSHLSHSALP